MLGSVPFIMVVSSLLYQHREGVSATFPWGSPFGSLYCGGYRQVSASSRSRLILSLNKIDQDPARGRISSLNGMVESDVVQGSRRGPESSRSSGPSPCPYSPNVLEGEFSEVRIAPAQSCARLNAWICHRIQGHGEARRGPQHHCGTRFRSAVRLRDPVPLDDR